MWTREQFMVVFRVLMIVAKMVAVQYCYDLATFFSRVPMLNFNCVEDQLNLGIVHSSILVFLNIMRLLVAHWTASFASSIGENVRNLGPLVNQHFQVELIQLRVAMVNFLRYLDQLVPPRNRRQG